MTASPVNPGSKVRQSGIEVRHPWKQGHTALETKSDCRGSQRNTAFFRRRCSEDASRTRKRCFGSRAGTPAWYATRARTRPPNRRRPRTTRAAWRPRRCSAPPAPWPAAPSPLSTVSSATTSAESGSCRRRVRPLRWPCVQSNVPIGGSACKSAHGRQSYCQTPSDAA